MAWPQVVAAVVGFVAAGASLLAVSSLRSADGADDTADKYCAQGGGGGEEAGTGG